MLSLLIRLCCAVERLHLVSVVLQRHCDARIVVVIMRNVYAFSRSRVHESPLTCITAGLFVLLSQTLTTMSADARRPVRPLQPRRAHRRPREAAVTVCFSAAALAADSGCVQRLALAASSPSSPAPMSTCWFPCVRSDLGSGPGCIITTLANGLRPLVSYPAFALISSCAPQLRPWLCLHHPR